MHLVDSSVAVMRCFAAALPQKLYGERSAAKEAKVASVKGSKEPSRAVSVASARYAPMDGWATPTDRPTEH